MKRTHSGVDTRPRLRTAPEELARRLLTHEAGEQQDQLRAGEQVYLRLRNHLAVLLGTTGFDALWARAIRVAQHEFHSGDDSTTDESIVMPISVHPPGLHAAVSGHHPAVALQNLVIAYASFLTLLFTFIGEDLGVRFIRQIWPSLPQDALELRAEEPHHE
jgi:hypothetical protein